jgi:hypothetical protein
MPTAYALVSSSLLKLLLMRGLMCSSLMALQVFSTACKLATVTIREVGDLLPYHRHCQSVDLAVWMSNGSLDKVTTKICQAGRTPSEAAAAGVPRGGDTEGTY